MLNAEDCSFGFCACISIPIFHFFGTTSPNVSAGDLTGSHRTLSRLVACDARSEDVGSETLEAGFGRRMTSAVHSNLLHATWLRDWLPELQQLSRVTPCCRGPALSFLNSPELRCAPSFFL